MWERGEVEELFMCNEKFQESHVFFLCVETISVAWIRLCIHTSDRNACSFKGDVGFLV